MTHLLMRTCCLAAIGILGCAQSKWQLIGDLSPGLSADEVLEIVGEPAIRSSRDQFEAWRYEYRVLNVDNCSTSGGITNACTQACEHATVWFNENAVRSVTMLRVKTVERCGEGSLPIIWDQMPDYAVEPTG